MTVATARLTRSDAAAAGTATPSSIRAGPRTPPRALPSVQPAAGEVGEFGVPREWRRQRRALQPRSRD